MFKKFLVKKAAEGQARAAAGKKVGVMAMFAMLAIAAIPSAVGAAPIAFDSANIGVTTTDVVATGFNFMGMFNEWTMLVLGIIFAPVAIGFIIWLWKKLPKFKTGS